MTDLGVQLHGGAGYMDEYEISHLFTAARISRIYAGSSEIMKLIIGRDIFLKIIAAHWLDEHRHSG